LATLKDVEDVQKFEPLEFIAEGDKVVAIGEARTRVRAGGQIISTPWVHVFTFSHARIARFRSFYDTAAAAAAFCAD
jgi:ketosteroid isomerase-like protein